MHFCPRFAFFEYYSEGEPESYAAWNLRELVTPPMIVGEVVDYLASSALERVRKGKAFPTNFTEVGERTFNMFLSQSQSLIESMRTKARTASDRRQGIYKPLQTDWYGLDLGKEYFDSLRANVIECLTNFEQGDCTARILSSRSEDWAPSTRTARTRPSFKVDGTRVFASFDFMFRIDKSLHILDWKSGASTQFSQGSTELQLGVYALYGTRSQGIQPQNVFVQPVWLRERGRWEPQSISSQRLQEIERMIVANRDLERSVVEISDSDGSYHADRKQFPATPTVAKCTYCKYREICSEGRAVCKHLEARPSVEPMEGQDG